MTILSIVHTAPGTLHVLGRPLLCPGTSTLTWKLRTGRSSYPQPQLWLVRVMVQVNARSAQPAAFTLLAY